MQHTVSSIIDSILVNSSVATKKRGRDIMFRFVFVSVVLFLLLFSFSIEEQTVYREEDDDSTSSNGGKSSARMFNFASHTSGAVILDKSPESGKGFGNLLNDDKDKYAISNCQEKKWVVIGLSEDIRIKAVTLSNFEKYSSSMKDFQVLCAMTFPTSEWIDLGTYTAEPKLGEQVFNVTPANARFLKLKFLTHYDNEALCTLSQIKVYGLTIMEYLKQDSDLLQQPDVKGMLKGDNASTSAENESSSGDKVDDINIQNSSNDENSNEDSTASDGEDKTSSPDDKKDNSHNSANSEELNPRNEDHVGDNTNKTDIVAGDNDDKKETTVEIVDEDNRHYQNLFDVFQRSQMETKDELESKKETIAGLELNIADWQKVYQIFEESGASMNILSNTIKRITEFIDPLAIKVGLKQLQGHLSSSSPPSSSQLPAASTNDSAEDQADSNASKSEVQDLNNGDHDSQGDENNMPRTLETNETSNNEAAINIEGPSSDTPAFHQTAMIADEENHNEKAGDIVKDDSLKNPEVDEVRPEKQHNTSDDLVPQPPSNFPQPTNPNPAIERVDPEGIKIPTIKDMVSSAGGIPFNCYETLEFDEFQEKMLQKLQGIKDESANSGMAHHTDHIFKVFAQRVRSVELNEAILEMYIEQVTTCFKVVSTEVSIQQQKNQELSNKLVALEDSMSKRIQALEESVAAAAAATKSTCKLTEEVSQESSITSSDELHLLQFVKAPNLKEDVATLEDAFHRILYYFLQGLKDLKMKIVPSIKSTNWFNKIFHRSKHFKENKEHFLATHSSWEIYREYMIEIFLIVLTLGLALAIMSSLLLGCFMIFMWCLYHFNGKNKNNKQNNDNHNNKH